MSCDSCQNGSPLHFVQRIVTLASTSFCWIVPTYAAPSKPDYSKEAFVIQQFSKHITFSAVGTWQIEQTAAVLL
jgi:hypothetical protein